MKACAYWKFEDYVQGQCARDDVDKPKPQPQPEVEVLPPLLDLKEVPARRIKNDVMRAYNNLGGADWLEKLGQRDPELFAKFALKILPQAVESEVKLEVTSINDVAAIPTATLKAMLLEHLVKEKGNDPEV